MLLGIWVGASACTQLYISRPDRISSPRCDWEDLGSFLIYTLSEGRWLYLILHLLKNLVSWWKEVLKGKNKQTKTRWHQSSLQLLPGLQELNRNRSLCLSCAVWGQTGGAPELCWVSACATYWCCCCCSVTFTIRGTQTLRTATKTRFKHACLKYLLT